MSDERRSAEPGRRKEDYLRYCPEHQMRVELANERHGNAEKRDAAICGKVTAVEEKVGKRVDHLEGALDKMRETIVGRWVFWVVITVLFAAVGGIGIQQNWAFKEMLENQREFSNRLAVVSDQGKDNANEIRNVSATLEVLSKRQDVLRDQNLKLLEQVGGTR